MNDKPTCAVQGLIRRGAMCSQIIVGRKLCGYSGTCEHQRPPTDTVSTMEDWRTMNSEPEHGRGHMQGRGAA